MVWECVLVWERERESECVWTEWTWSMHYIGISTYQFILYYASAIHKHTHPQPFEDIELTGLKVDIAVFTLSPGEG